MNKKLLLKLFLNTHFLVALCFFNRSYKISAQEINAKKNSCSITQHMFNAGYTQVVQGVNGSVSDVVLNMEGRKIDCEFINLSKPDREENQKKRNFAILIDSKKGPVDFQFLDKDLKCTLTSPADADVLAIHLYGQNEKDPDFLLHEENFICKTKFLPLEDNLLYKTYTKDSAIRYSKKGKERNKKGSIWGKYSNNAYSLGEFYSDGNDDYIGVLEFPNGEHKEMSYEDRVIPICTFNINENDDDDQDENIMPSGKLYYNFKLPDDVKKFNIKLYDFSIEDCASYDPESATSENYNYQGYHAITLPN